MSMLAEERRRQKFSSDPRGLNWANDDQKFGQKLMEKTGWTKGKGLGAQENGMTEHIKVKSTQDAKGVGYTRKHCNDWVAHQEDFSDLLANLNADYSKGEDPENIKEAQHKVINLEQKSKSSKHRVHYMKFTKGKDLSSRNQEELDCIFGRRQGSADKSRDIPEESSTSSDEAAPTADSVDNLSKEQESPKMDHSHGIQTITSSSSIAEYFSEKMAKLKQARAGSTTGGPASANTGDGDSSDGSRGAATELERTGSAVDWCVGNSEKKRQRKKEKRKKKDRVEDEVMSDNGIEETPRSTKNSNQESLGNIPDENELEEVSARGSETKRKSKKRTKRESLVDSSNEAKVEEEAGEVSVPGKKSKKKKKQELSESDTYEHKMELECEKGLRSKRKPQESVDDTPFINKDGSLDDVPDGSNMQQDVDEVSMTKKKSKKRKRHQSLEDGAHENEVEDDGGDSSVPKKETKRRKNQSPEDDAAIEISNRRGKKGKRHSKTEGVSENGTVRAADYGAEANDADPESGVKTRSKGKHDKEDDLLENPPKIQTESASSIQGAFNDDKTDDQGTTGTNAKNKKLKKKPKRTASDPDAILKLNHPKPWVLSMKLVKIEESADREKGVQSVNVHRKSSNVSQGLKRKMEDNKTVGVFPGSNLMDVRGYGGGGNIGYHRQRTVRTSKPL